MRLAVGPFLCSLCAGAMMALRPTPSRLLRLSTLWCLGALLECSATGQGKLMHVPRDSTGLTLNTTKLATASGQMTAQAETGPRPSLQWASSVLSPPPPSTLAQYLTLDDTAMQPQGGEGVKQDSGAGNVSDRAGSLSYAWSLVDPTPACLKDMAPHYCPAPLGTSRSS
jgi:hypothetical protein